MALDTVCSQEELLYGHVYTSPEQRAMLPYDMLRHRSDRVNPHVTSNHFAVAVCSPIFAR